MTDFAKELQETWTATEEADKDNRKEMLEDLQFEGFQQWHPTVKQQRENRPGDLPPLPCLVNNTVVAFINQVVGDRMANATSIKVLPREDGDKEVAEVRSELMRSIELQSKASRAYLQAFRPQVSCGVGNFRVDLDYADEEVFERDLFIRGIPNPLSVLWDPMSTDPTGRDAEYCFVSERIRKEDYKARFGEDASSFLNEDTGGSEWVDSETVRVAEWWQMAKKKKMVAMTPDGKVVDITGAGKPEMGTSFTTNQPAMMVKGPTGLVEIAVNPSTGEPMIRDTECGYAKRTLTNGKEPLEDDFELKIPRVPIIRCMGQEIWVGDKRIRFGLTRLMRDNKRLDNYMLSVAAEKLMFAPRHSYIASEKQIEGREGDWPNTQVYNSDGNPPPQETTQNNLQALLALSEVFSQNMKEVTGIYEANLGSRSNETSGVAIRARQSEGDIATIVYHENFNAAMQEAGEILNALIPVVYDTARTIRTVGEDDAVKLIKVNDPNNPEAIDLVTGKYDVTISTGPAYMTKRIESAASMMEAARDSNGELFRIAGDLIADAQDWPNADKIAKRIKKSLPPNLQDEDEQDLTPEEKAQRQQKAMEAEQMAQHMADLQRREAEAKVAEAEAKARKAVKEADDAEQGINKQSVDAHNAETQRLKAVTAKDFPLPPSAVAMLAPVVTKAIMDALSSPDALPFALHAEIAEEAYDQAEDARVKANAPPEMPSEEQAA